LTALYVASLAESQGKTAFCAAVGKWFHEKGKKVGYFKPLHTSQLPDKDTTFLKKVLSLDKPAELLSPININEAPADLELKVKAAYDTISNGKDIVLVEGIGGLSNDGTATQASLKLIGLLNAKVLLIARYSARTSADIQAAAGKIKEHLLGVVINAVPARKLAQAKEILKTELQEKGIKVLGVLPQHRSLFTISVSELAENLGGKQLVPVTDSGGLVENIMMGVHTPDSALLYYGRKAKKAVLMRGDRSDMQLAALETSTCCLVLTGDKKPMPFITAEAKNKGVPVIVSPKNDLAIIEQVEKLLNQARFHQKEKLEVMGQLMTHHFDFDAMRHGLGLKP
jgi:uncharacterized protein